MKEYVLENFIEMFIESSRITVKITDQPFGDRMLYAIVNLTFGAMEIRGWTIISSNFGDELDIKPPRAGKKGRNQKDSFYFFIRSEKHYDKLRKRIREAYENKREEVSTEEVIDDIKF
ncbi:MAG: hypothetical protein PHW75_00460 [Patescibacteria group bacterium]|nr:hypothetical protein [Patescibacteria group bacterium]